MFDGAALAHSVLFGVGWRRGEVTKRGKASLRVSSGLPALPEGFTPGWPVAGYELRFEGRLARGTQIDLGFYLGGASFDQPFSRLRLLEWNGKSYRDVTRSVDSTDRCGPPRR